MRRFTLVVFIAILGLALQNSIDFNIYHTSDEINEKATQIVKECSQKAEIKQLHKNPDLRVIKINEGVNKESQGFVLFGEHPREMISPETGLQFLSDVCKNDSKLAQKVNKDYSLQIILNANPLSRQKVEKGDYCLRLNEDGVDINRNYDAHWEFNDDSIMQINSGPEPFSEVETQTIKSLLENQQPDYFITVHSGALGLFTPYAYSQDLPQGNGVNMLSVMQSIGDQFCSDCEVGPAGEAVGYVSTGTCLDYAYDEMNIPYSYAVEIYSQAFAFELDKESKKNSLLQKKYDYMSDLKDEHRSGNYNQFLEIQNRIESENENENENLFKDDYEKCFEFFNPANSDHYEVVTNKWSNILLQSLSQSQENKKQQE